MREAEFVSESLSSCWACHTEEAKQAMPVKFGDDCETGQSAKDELEQHAAAAWVKIGVGRGRRYQTEE